MGRNELRNAFPMESTVLLNERRLYLYTFRTQNGRKMKIFSILVDGKFEWDESFPRQRIGYSMLLGEGENVTKDG